LPAPVNNCLALAGGARRPGRNGEERDFPSHVALPVYIYSAQSKRTFALLDSGAQGMKTTPATLGFIAVELAIATVHAQVVERPIPHIETEDGRYR
jgi:hypothetical protein